MRLQLLVSRLHAAVCMTVSLMKSSPGGLLMWANCCWARGWRLGRDRCSSLPPARTMAQAAGLCVCVCLITVYMSVCAPQCVFEGEQMAPPREPSAANNRSGELHAEKSET